VKFLDRVKKWLQAPKRAAFYEGAYLRATERSQDAEVTIADLREQLQVSQSDRKELATTLLALEKELRAAADARVKAEDRERDWRMRSEAADQDRMRIQEELHKCYKKIANFEAVRQGFLVVPFPEEYVPMPREQVVQSGGGDDSPFRPRNIREAQMMAVNKSRREAEARRQRILDALEQNNPKGESA
jgi:hypothetical protein